MDIAVDPNLPLLDFRQRGEQLLDIMDLGVETNVWVDPLSIQVDAGHTVSIVTAHNSIWVEARN